MASRHTPKVPGEEQQRKAPAPAAAVEDGANEKVRAGVSALDNTTGKTANDAGKDHEALVRGMAAADAARRGVRPDLAPEAEIGAPAEPSSIKREAIINGKKVMVDVPVVRKNSAVEAFGPESKLPPGTLVNKDGTAHEGPGDAYGIIGNIDTPQGKLVSRIIPFDAVQAAA